MPLEEFAITSRGYHLFVEEGPHGGNVYWSDEVGGGIMVYDTMIDPETIERCLQHERDIEKYKNVNV